MDSIAAHQFRELWQAVAAVELAEDQETTLAERWQQMNRLLAMATVLRLDLSERDEDIVRLRWAKLKGTG